MTIHNYSICKTKTIHIYQYVFGYSLSRYFRKSRVILEITIYHRDEWPGHAICVQYAYLYIITVKQNYNVKKNKLNGLCLKTTVDQSYYSSGNFKPREENLSENRKKKRNFRYIELCSKTIFECCQ